MIKEKRLAFQNAAVSVEDWEELKKKIPTWQEVFLNADTEAKRVLGEPPDQKDRSKER